MRDYLSLLRQPRWVVLTLLVPVGIALCLLAADWQYSRHVGRAADQAQVEQSSAAGPAALPELAPPGAPYDPDLRYRTVTAAGQFIPGSEVLVRKRVLDGSPGYWAVAALRTDDGSVVQVLRGWVPLGQDARSSPPVAPPPAGAVTVTGWLDTSTEAPGEAPGDLPTGQVVSLDTARLGEAAGAAPSEIVGPALVATSMGPPDTGTPGMRAVPVPRIGLGPHLAYSWQWVFFALLLPTGWVILARREVQGIRAERQPSAPAAATDPESQRFADGDVSARLAD